MKCGAKHPDHIILCEKSALHEGCHQYLVHAGPDSGDWHLKWDDTQQEPLKFTTNPDSCGHPDFCALCRLDLGGIQPMRLPDTAPDNLTPNQRFAIQLERHIIGAEQQHKAHRYSDNSLCYGCLPIASALDDVERSARLRGYDNGHAEGYMKGVRQGRHEISYHNEIEVPSPDPACGKCILGKGPGTVREAILGLLCLKRVNESFMCGWHMGHEGECSVSGGKP